MEHERQLYPLLARAASVAFRNVGGLIPSVALCILIIATAVVRACWRKVVKQQARLVGCTYTSSVQATAQCHMSHLRHP